MAFSGPFHVMAVAAFAIIGLASLRIIIKAILPDILPMIRLLTSKDDDQ